MWQIYYVNLLITILITQAILYFIWRIISQSFPCKAKTWTLCLTYIARSGPISLQTLLWIFVISTKLFYKSSFNSITFPSSFRYFAIANFYNSPLDMVFPYFSNLTFKGHLVSLAYILFYFLYLHRMLYMQHSFMKDHL